MNPDSPIDLIHACLDGEATPEQHARLESLLREDWQVRRLYLELADQHARLLRQPELNTGRLHEAAPPLAGPRPPAWWKPALLPLAAAVAAVAVFLASGIPWRTRGADSGAAESTASGVATLSETLDARFRDFPRQRGDALPPGLLRLDTGLAQVDFFCGATVLIEGPCELDLLSPWEARCLRGRVRVHVPPAAKGFLLHAPNVKLEDLGTEFALNVRDGTSAVHVFAGEVIAHPRAGSPASLRQGMTFSSGTGGATVSPQDFLPVGDLAAQKRHLAATRLATWKQWAESQRGDARLIARYLFQRHADDRWDRLVMNAVEPRVPSRAGGAVGARWTQGRWPDKDALEFKRPGDRVRMNLDGTYAALSFSCWVKVDSVDKKYNALLLTDGYEPGEPHWQIHQDGRLMFSIAYADGVGPVTNKNNQIYLSPPVFTAGSLGRWHHIAVTYDSRSGDVIQYFDGTEASREISPHHRPGRPITFGPCEIGNWGLPTSTKNFPVRNLNGAIDEFAIYSAVLSQAEIRSIHEHGKPDS
jgi:hypothetical protein